MTEPSLMADKMIGAARAAWVDAARDVLIAGGISALNLRGLAASLGVTTGAFYSVFSGLEDLHDALRQAWLAQNVVPMIDAMAMAGPDGFQQYLAALRLTVLEGGVDTRFDNAIRDWAHSAPRTAQILATADTLRIGALEKMFLALGDDEKRAQIRARIAYFHQVGYGTLEIHDDPDERLLNLRYYAEALTGRDDLMICETADEVRQFILTGLSPAKDTQLTRKLILVRHHDKPDDDRVQAFAEANGFTPVSCRPYLGDALPDLSPDVAGVVVFGGRQSAANEQDHPYLTDEMAWIKTCLAADVPMLGICLGAQMIIKVLGGQVGPLNGNLHEFGYYPVSPTPEGRDFLSETLHVTEAHYHTFTLPEGVTLLASGENYANQAFRYGDKVYGVQFHPECTAEIFRRWQESETAAYGKPGAQTREEQDRLIALHDAAQGAWFNGFMERLFLEKLG